MENFNGFAQASTMCAVGFEPTYTIMAFRVSAERSNRTELCARQLHNLLPKVSLSFDSFLADQPLM